MKHKVAIAIHGGAGQNSKFIEENYQAYMEGLKTAIQYGHQLLSKGISAIDAVEETVRILEDNPLFNAGKGAALNAFGEVEMDAAIMDGNLRTAGAVSIVRKVKNPISLAKKIMEQGKHVHLSGYGALIFAENTELELMPDDYFIVQRQLDDLNEERSAGHGTVGCVALDSAGRLASATSTGGTSNSLPGRVGDSCMIGAGCFADDVCASSCTGDGEVIITNVVAHKVALLVELTEMSLQEACDFIVNNTERIIPGDVGVVSVDRNGNVAFSFNCDRMHRASIDESGELYVEIYHTTSILK